MLQDVDDLVSTLRTIDSVDGVIVFGSRARRDSSARSDLDVILIVDAASNANQTRKAAKQIISPGKVKSSLVVYTASQLIVEIEQRPSFGAHLSDEAHFAYCADSCCKAREMVRNFIIDDRALSRELDHERESLDLFADTDRFNRHFISSLSRLYSIARSIAIIKLLQAGVHEYRWQEIFGKLSEIYPELKDDLKLLASLRPFYEYFIDRRTELIRDELPNEDDIATKIAQSVRALRLLAERGEGSRD